MINTRPPQSPTMAIKPLCPTCTNEFQSDEHNNLSFQSAPQHNQRRVRFSSTDENDSQSAPHKELTAEMIEDMWFTSEEITKFKHDVRSLVIRKAQNNGIVDDNEEEMSGLEKYNPQRSAYKKSALYHILHAQKKSRDPHYLRAVSRRSTAWARAIANEQGFKDYCAVYDPLDDLLEFENLDFMNDNQNDSSVTMQKRNHEGEIQMPSKRQRLSQ